MPHQFRKHYSREEATALLPQIRGWLTRLNELRLQLEKADKRVGSMIRTGDDIGGDQVNRWITIMAQMQELLLEFQRREIQVKDMERGLVDFPAIIGGREVFLCWELDEDDVEFWHDLDTGYSGRERLD
jgi:hypothetical protein